MSEPIRSIVLCYHGVSEAWENSVAVRPDSLRRQLELVLERGYRSVTFSEAVARPECRVVAVTFDDAFLSVHSLALPILNDLGMVGTIFVPTMFVTTGEALDWDGYDDGSRGSEEEMQPLSWALVRDLGARGWETGSHTRTHPHLRALETAALVEELGAAREECALGTGVPCDSIAYPYGEVNRRVRDAAEQAGYLTGAALGPQWRRGDPLWWPRTGVYRDDDIGRFGHKLQPISRSRAFVAGLNTVRRISAAVR